MGSLRNYCYIFNDSYVSNTIRFPVLGVAFVFRQKEEQKSPLCSEAERGPELLGCSCDFTGPPSLLEPISTEENGCMHISGSVLDTGNKAAGLVVHSANA